MELFSLPHTTKVNKAVPKSAFDRYINSRQKKLFTDAITRITWLNKLSPDTVNLEANTINEIQVFKIELKARQDIKSILEIIDKAIPYHIVFIVQFEVECYLSTSPKHPHPIQEDNAVIDWTFKTEWFPASQNIYNFDLKKSIDALYQNFCAHLAEQPNLSSQPLEKLIDHNRQLTALQKKIARIKATISNTLQFNKKVELNMRLKALENKLEILIHSQ